MKKIFLQLTMSLLATVCTYGATSVTINAATVTNFQDADGSLLSSGVLALLVLDTEGDGFGDVDTSSSFTIDSFLSDGNDRILNVVESTAGVPIAGIPDSIQAGGVSVELIDGVDAGDAFAVYWFPALSLSDTSAGLGDSYGVTFDSSTWILPATGITNTNSVTNPGAALFEVIEAVPEPSSTALLGLGGLALLARRRRS